MGNHRNHAHLIEQLRVGLAVNVDDGPIEASAKRRIARLLFEHGPRRAMARGSVPSGQLLFAVGTARTPHTQRWHRDELYARRGAA